LIDADRWWSVQTISTSIDVSNHRRKSIID